VTYTYNTPNPVAQAVPEDEQRITMFREVLKQGMQPEDIAEVVFDGIRSDRLYVLSHDHFTDMIKLRADNITKGNNPEQVDPSMAQFTRG
jgi:hypothetical protein